ncbi:MAG: response regulator transcription factor [Clostridia bacterium]
MKQIIYAVEDDSSIGELYKVTFESMGYIIEVFKNAEEMLDVLRYKACNLLVLDIMLPKMDGITALKAIRAETKNNNIPIIMISAKGDEMSKVTCLDCGADDYLAKPFGVLELMARVKANLRKQKVQSNNNLCFEEIEIIDEEHIVKVDGNVVNLTLKEYNLLKTLIEKKDTVISRESLLFDVWGYEYIEGTRTLDVHIKSLRNKIAQFTKNQYIQTIRGIGYKISL